MRLLDNSQKAIELLWRFFIPNNAFVVVKAPRTSHRLNATYGQVFAGVTLESSCSAENLSGLFNLQWQWSKFLALN